MTIETDEGVPAATGPSAEPAPANEAAPPANEAAPPANEAAPPANEAAPPAARRIAPATLGLVLLLIAVWIVGRAAGVDPYDPRWALTRSIDGWLDLWRLLGSSFFHSDLFHLAGNVLVLWLVGVPVERMIGARGLLALFALGALAASAVFLFTHSLGSAVGASGGAYAVQGAALVALARNWRVLRRRARVRLLSPFAVPIAQLFLIPLSGEYGLDLPFISVRFSLELELLPPAIHLMHGASLVVGAVAALWLLQPRPWLGAVRRRRATAVACGVAAAAVAVAALVVDEPGPTDLAACEAGDRARCADMAERFRPLCDAGDAQSCHNLGVFAERGYTGPADATAAASHYRSACELGYASACFNLGNLMTRGVTPGRPEEARALFDRSCRAGLPEGCNGLGYLLFVGAGGPRDIEGAMRLAEGACQAEVAMACRNLAIFTMTVHKESGMRRAADLFGRACKLGDTEACTMSNMLELQLAVGAGGGLPGEAP